MKNDEKFINALTNRTIVGTSVSKEALLADCQFTENVFDSIVRYMESEGVCYSDGSYITLVSVPSVVNLEELV